MSEAASHGDSSEAACGNNLVMRMRRYFDKLDAVEWLAVGAIALGIAARFAARPGAPLWLDEAATGAIISQPDFSSFWQEVHWEVSSPLYFLFMRPWQAIFGLSNLSLRAPSLIFSAAAPLAIALAPIHDLKRADRLAWAALVALWIPGIGYSQDARCYALVLLFSSLQTMAYIEMLRRTSLRSTSIWVALCSLTTATHYDAAVLALAQGFIFLALKRLDALKQWPSILIISPVVAAVAWHWPEMSRFMQPDTTWYRVVDAEHAVGAIRYLFAPLFTPIAIPFLILLIVGLLFTGRRVPPVSIAPQFFWSFVASLTGAAFLIGAGSIRPLFTARYLAPCAPGAFLFIVLLLQAIGRGRPKLATGASIVLASLLCGLWLFLGAMHTDSVAEPLNYERASAELMKKGVRRFVFAWDNPNARAMHPEQIAAFGGFFFHRAGIPAEVTPVQLDPSEDPNAALLRAAGVTNTGIIWIYDTWVRGTSATNHPPAIAQINAAWNCQEDKKLTFGVVTCIRQQNP